MRSIDTILAEINSMNSNAHDLSDYISLGSLLNELEDAIEKYGEDRYGDGYEIGYEAGYYDHSTENY